MACGCSWDKLPSWGHGDTVTNITLAAATQEDPGPVTCMARDGRAAFDLGTQGAGRYVVEW